MYVGSSYATISAAISAAIVYFRVRGNKLSHRKLAINWQLWLQIITGSFDMKMVNLIVYNLYFFIFDLVLSLNITLIYMHNLTMDFETNAILSASEVNCHIITLFKCLL